MKAIKAAVKRVGQPPTVEMIGGGRGHDSQLKAYQALVGGTIDMIDFPYIGGLLMVINDDGKFTCKPNFPVPKWRDIIYGDFCVVGNDFKGRERSLTESELEAVMGYLNRWRSVETETGNYFVPNDK